MKASIRKSVVLVLLIVALVQTTLVIGIPAAAQDEHWPTDGWRTSTPEEQGIDSAQLLSALDRMEDNGTTFSIHSMLVIRHGYIVLDVSMAPANAELPHATYSVAKSVLSTLVGIAIDQGYIEGVDQSIWDYFDKTSTAEMDERKEALVLENLLTMSSGMRLDDQKMYSLSGSEQPWVQFVLDQRMLNEPGTSFHYADAVSHITSALFSQATGQSALAFGQENLFAPLGITDVTWLADPQGVSLGGDGLYLTPYDMAKLGYLYLHEGQWDGQQIVSSAWVKAATTSTGRGDYGWGYGYYWWVSEPRNLPPDTPNLYFAAGYAGQTIFVVPEKDLIVVFTGGSEPSSNADVQIFLENILPAVKSDEPLPANPDVTTELDARVQTLAHPEPAPVEPAPTIAVQVSGQTYLLTENKLNWTSIAVAFGETEALLTLETGEGRLELPLGLDGVYRLTPITRQTPMTRLGSLFWPLPRVTDTTLAARGYWLNETTFVIVLCDAIGLESWLLHITYVEAGITLRVSEIVQAYNTTLKGSLP
jgi:CubicO group peptidase (beta-lactamase class C family)